MTGRRPAALGSAWLLSLLPICGAAHELPADRLTLVQREATHVSLTFRVDDIALMKRLVAPRASNADFLMPLSTMGDDGFTKALALARSRFESGVALRDARGRALRIERWRWPPAEDVRRRIRAVVMQSMVGDGAHVHAEPVEVTADALSASAIEEVDLKLPEAAGAMVVVSYRPLQQDYRAGRPAPLRIRFGAAAPRGP